MLFTKSIRAQPAVGNCWIVVVLNVSESTASDNPVSDDAFMDSLFLKVSLMFLKHTKAQKQCGNAHQDAEGRS